MHPTARRIAIIAAVVLATTVAARAIDVSRVLGDVKGDESTYIAMTESLAHDGDLRYDARDLTRFLHTYPEGPKGIFLKRAYTLHPSLHGAWPFVSIEKTPVSDTESLAYGKAFIYPLAAAPFVAIGGLGGMLVLTVLLFFLCLWCGVRFCQARLGPVAGAGMGAAFFVASIVPEYIVWLTPEIFNVTLVTVAFFVWLYKGVVRTRLTGWLGRSSTDVAAACLLGAATFSKPNHALLVAPLVVCLLLARRWRHAVIATLAFGVTAVGLFGVNAIVTGEANYQGSSLASGAPDATGRKSFYPEQGYPFDAKGTQFATSTLNMTTNDTSSEETTTSDVFTRLLPANLWYVLAGRDAGLVPFFFPGLVTTIMALVRWRRLRVWQVTTLLACVGSLGAFLVIAPYTWNGAGGPPGNRYFLSVYPTMLFLVPAGANAAWAVVAAAVGLVFTAPLSVHPVHEAHEPWSGVDRPPFTWLPVELTIATDLPVDLHPQRGRVPFTHTPEVIFTYMDPNTYYAEGDGLWIAGHASTDIIVRTEMPLTWIRLDVTGKHVSNTVTATIGGQSTSIAIDPDGGGSMLINPRAGQWFHTRYAVVLHLSTTNGFVPADVEGGSDRRNLGVFIRPTFSIARLPQ